MLNALLFAAGLWAGPQNCLAGGASFITLPALIPSGMTPLAASITSTVALFPGQVTTGLAGRKLVTGGRPAVSFRALFVISILRGVLGGLLLPRTPSSVFARLVPWLVLFATAVFAWGSFARKPDQGSVRLGPPGAAVTQFLIAIYGGCFGGGIGFLMMAALTMAGLPTRDAAATKNVLAAVMNASAVALFVTSPQVHWREAVVLGAGAIIGGLCGAWTLHRVDEWALRLAIVALAWR